VIELPTAIASAVALTLRITPLLAFAPPFTLIRVPVLVRALLGVGLSATMVAAHSTQSLLADASLSTLAPAAARELALGCLFVLVFQLVFGALYVAGRTIDVQAGFGLALLIDPTSQNQTPLVGALFAYAAGAIFVALDGHVAMLRLISASLDAVPLGSWTMPGSIERIPLLLATTSSIALGFAGAAIMAFFLIDLSIAFLSRTVPQMNVLVLGFQVKTLALLLILPIVFGLGGAMLVRLLVVGIEAIPGLI
jgi:flagellar biosynthesis protein FliR